VAFSLLHPKREFEGVMAKRLASWWIPTAAFVAAVVMAFFAGPSLGFSSRLMMDYTGKRYYCWRCTETNPCETKESETDLTGQDGWKCSSLAPVNFFTGENAYTAVDLKALGVGKWGMTRAYLGTSTYSDGALGPCWRQGEMFRLIRRGSQVWVISGNAPTASFDDLGGGAYSPHFDYTSSMVSNAPTNEIWFTDVQGRRFRFFDFSGVWSAARQGRLKQIEDPAGNVTTLIYGSSGVTLDKVLEVQQTDTNPALLHRFIHSYYLSGASLGLLAGVNYVQTTSGVDTTVRVLGYSYYPTTGPNGPAGTLQRVRVSDAAAHVLETQYYRYGAMDGTGWMPLRYVVQASAYERLLASVGGTDAAVDAATDTAVAAFADFFFQYGANHVVTSETVQGEGCGCGTSGGKGVFGYSLIEAVNGFADGPNVWRRRNVMTYPDGNQLFVYMNGAGQTMLEVFKEVSTGTQWRKYRQFNSLGSIQAVAFPSAVTGHDEALPGLVSSAHLPDATGLWHLYDYYATTDLPNGAVAKYGSAKRFRQGETGASVLQETHKFTSRTGSTGTIYPLASDIVYRNTDGTGAQTTSFGYTWQGTSNQILQKTTTSPIVPGTQNGSGAATSRTVQLDAFGRETWRRDPDGFIHATEYHPLTSAVTKRIVDVNTATSTNEPAGWVTPAGGGLHLTSTFDVDVLGRTTKVTDPAGNLSYAVYRDPEHEVRIYPGWDALTNLPTGPTRLLREDRVLNYRERLAMSATPSVVGGVPTGTEAIAGLQTLTREYLDNGSRVISIDSYFNLTGLVYTTSASFGTLGTNFYRRRLNYDIKGRRDREEDWTGTILRTAYDSRDRVVSSWIGTDDTPTTGDWSPTNTAGTNLIRIVANQYDAGLVGDGNLTKSTLLTNSASGLDTTYTYDFRQRFISQRGPDRIVRVPTYDNLDHPVIVDTYFDADNNGAVIATELRGRSEAKFDERGEAYQTIRHNVSSAGVVGNRLTTNFWYNGRRNQIKIRTPNGLFQKSQFDGAGRTKATFASFDDAETTYAAALDVVGDSVIEETVLSFDAAGNVLQQTHYERSSAAAVPAGDLATGWLAANSRRTFVAVWYDLANRKTTLADYGTNGNASFARPATPPAPNSSSNILVTKFEYEAGGRQHRTTNNLAKVTVKTFDGLGRTTQVVEDFVDGVAAETELDTDRTTLLTYDSSGRLSQMIALNPKGTGLGVEQQVTQYVYGTTANVASPAVFRNDVLVAEIYPDSDDTYNPAGAAGSKLGNGADAVYDRLEYTYDYASRRLTLKDQRQTLHTFVYKGQAVSGAGRLDRDVVTTLGAGVDGAIRAITRAYDGLSRLTTTTSYADTGLVTSVNSEVRVYDGWGNVSQATETHASPASVSTSTAYVDGAVSGEAKYVRVANTTYPNGRQVHRRYSASGVGDKLSRIDAISNDAAGTLLFAQFGYLGRGAVVQETHPAVTGGLTLDYGVNTGSPAGWDRFGRIIDQKWGSTADPLQFERLQYTYSRVSQRLTSDRTYTGAPADRDEQYTYDNLHRLKTMKRGTLASGAIANTASTLNLEWNVVEAQGDWRTNRWDLDGGVASAGTITFTTQQRKHNKVNEIDVDNNDANAAGASISGTNADWIDPQYDKSGTLKNGPKVGAETVAASRQHYTYDAWNRLVKVQVDNGAGAPGATIAEYQYDGRNRRIVKLKPNGANWDRRDYYHTQEWQVVEERELLNTASKTTAATTPKFQWVWDPRYVDTPILRDENKDGDGDCIDGTDQRIYYAHDANYNVTALVTAAGTVVERYAYDPYGRAYVFTAAWAPQASTIYNNEILFAGYRLNPETGLYQVRNREYHPTLGRWAQRDPLKYIDSANLYEYVRGDPLNRTDPPGTGPCDKWEECLKKCAAAAAGDWRDAWGCLDGCNALMADCQENDKERFENIKKEIESKLIEKLQSILDAASEAVGLKPERWEKEGEWWEQLCRLGGKANWCQVRKQECDRMCVGKYTVNGQTNKPKSLESCLQGCNVAQINCVSGDGLKFKAYWFEFPE